MSSCNIITLAQRKSPLEISNPNRPLFYLQLFEYMTSDNPTANCVPNSNCSHGNFKHKDDFPASLRREDTGLLAAPGSAMAARPEPGRHCCHQGSSAAPLRAPPASWPSLLSPPLCCSGHRSGFGLLKRQTAALGPTD